uniref:Uncharacterized protein n=1 Tax=Steinernema glaseri TaxID=37863 RepID=A0A1I8A1C7_9BILA
MPMSEGTPKSNRALRKRSILKSERFLRYRSNSQRARVTQRCVEDIAREHERICEMFTKVEKRGNQGSSRSNGFTDTTSTAEKCCLLYPGDRLVEESPSGNGFY